MAITSEFANLATVTRASKAWDPGAWDFVSGSAVGALVEYASGVARTTPSGLLAEEGATNEIANPRWEGATLGVLGSGGDTPTGMGVNLRGGVLEIISVGSDDTGYYIELAASGSPTTSMDIILVPSDTVLASDGETFTISVGAKVVTGSAGLMDANFFTEASGSGLANNIEDLGTPDTTHRRFHATHTIDDGGTCTSLRQRVRIGGGLSNPVSYTIKLYMPQIEKKAYPTSIVLPTVASPAASTRAADVVTVPNGGWSNDNGAGTLYIDATLNNGGAASNYAWLGGYGVDNDNSIRVRLSQTSSLGAVAVDGGATQFLDSTVSLTGAGQNVRAAVAWATNDFAASFNGAAQSTDASGTVGFGAAVMTVANTGSSGPSSHYLADLRYFPRRLTNAELESLVGN
jgi:hypothetical protein